MNFYLVNTKKDNIMTQKDKEDSKLKKICRFFEKEITWSKVGDYRLMTGEYRCPAHKTCNINVIQKQSSFIPIAFDSFSNYDCHLFFKEKVEKKKDEVKFDIIPKTTEEYISVT